MCFAIGVLPVVVFLLGLVLLDSYKLVRLRLVLTMVAVGSVIALLALPLNRGLQAFLGLELRGYARLVAPLLEESLKASVIVWALARRRVGFLVDAAILGFAVGAGFAAVENVHYFMVLGEPRVAVWMVRGFGTAVMHGGTTSLMAVVSKYLTDRQDVVRSHLLLPGLALAVTIHAVYNSFLVSPNLSALVLLVGLPPLFLAVFRVSEQATQQWLGSGFDTDQELLMVIKRGEVSETRIGRYLAELTEHLAGPVVADMLCLLRLHLELSIKAKGILLMQKAGFEPPPDPSFEAHLAELRYLERSVGKTGLIALHPVLRTSSRDLWQIHMLRARRGGAGPESEVATG